MCHKDEKGGERGEELSGDERSADLLLSKHGSFETAVGCKDEGARC